MVGSTPTTTLNMTSGSPDWQPRIISSADDKEDLKISVTDADSSSAFAQEVQTIFIYNDGPNDVFFNNDAASTTSKTLIKAKAWMSLDLKITTPHFICASGETATVYVVGLF